MAVVLLVVLALISAVIIVIVWLVLRHRRDMLSLHKGIR